VRGSQHLKPSVMLGATGGFSDVMAYSARGKTLSVVHLAVTTMAMIDIVNLFLEASS
jgi:hypothetical protein